MTSLLMASDIYIAVGVIMLFMMATPIGLFIAKFTLVAARAIWHLLSAVFYALRSVFRLIFHLSCGRGKRAVKGFGQNTHVGKDGYHRL